jgi:glycosyltransferase involved in cell wall biosynthesis
MSTTKMNYREQTHSGNKIKISIIIPTYRSEKTIEKCLQSLLKQNYPKQNYEIIVVDNFSKDNSERIAKGLGVRFIKKISNPSEARNYGAKIAKGTIILFIDADCVAPKDLLKRVDNDFKKYDIGGVGGTYKTLNKESLIARYVGYEIGWRHSRSSKYTDFLGSYCSAYKKDIFLKFGGFDENFLIASGEDSELSFRISKHHKLLLDKDMFVWHNHPSSYKKYIRTQFWRAYWRVLMYKKFPEKILGESYTGKEIPMASFFMMLFLLSLLLSLFYLEFLYLAIIGLLAFFAVYTGFFRFLYKKEAGMIPSAMFILFSRTIVCFLGFAWGLLNIFRGN